MNDYASCCVLSFERPNFLHQCLVSMVEEASAPFELIVHDDGSSDSMVRRQLEPWLPHATVITNPPGHNQGQGTALNRMFAMATGDPIIKVDQDIIFLPGWLATVQSIMRANPYIGLLGLFHYHHEPCDSARTLVRQQDGFSTRTHILGSAFAVSRECFEQLGPFEEHDPAFGEDWTFQRKVTDSSAWVCALPDEDLVHNQGFGIGPSTVVIAPGTTQPIHGGPFVIGT